jgi:hypothetical protein
MSTVKMTRTEPMHKGGPTVADVHVDEVDNWAAHGWVAEEVAIAPAPLEVVEEESESVPIKGKPGRKPKFA